MRESLRRGRSSSSAEHGSGGDRWKGNRAVIQRGAGVPVSCSLERDLASRLCSAKKQPAPPRASHLTFFMVVSLDCCWKGEMYLSHWHPRRPWFLTRQHSRVLTALSVRAQHCLTNYISKPAERISIFPKIGHLPPLFWTFGPGFPHVRESSRTSQGSTTVTLFRDFKPGKCRSLNFSMTYIHSSR